MLRLCKHLLFVSCLLVCSALPSAAQQPGTDTVQYESAEPAVVSEEPELQFPERTIIYNTSKPDASQWAQATGDKAYSYRDIQEYSKNEPPPPIPGWYKLLADFVNFLTSPTGQVMLWTALGLIVAYVAYRVISGQGAGLFGQRDRTPSDSGREGAVVSEKGLLESDWETPLKAALAAGDARLAIRYSYMHLLQVMQQSGLIAYRPDKTNAGYYHELPERLQPSFRTVYRQYEYAWYGHISPGQAAMDSYMQTYTGLKKNIAHS